MNQKRSVVSLDSYSSKVYRLIFLLACLYNLSFGVWAVFFPQALFELFEMELPKYLTIWQCLGMVVGAYGILYGYAAWRLDTAKPIIAVGLVGKVLGFIGWIYAVASGEFPLKTFTLILFNDIIWWLPFILFLTHRTTLGLWTRQSAPYICAVLLILATAATVFMLQGGMEGVPEISLRKQHIIQNPFLWWLGWSVFIPAMISIGCFFAWWGARLPSQKLAIAALILEIIGVSSDLLGISFLLAWTPENLETIHRLSSMLTAGAGNGLNALAGVILTLGTPSLRGFLRVFTWTVWVITFSLTAATLSNSTIGMELTGGLVFTLYPLWVAFFGWKLKRGSPAS